MGHAHSDLGCIRTEHRLKILEPHCRQREMTKEQRPPPTPGHGQRLARLERSWAGVSLVSETWRHAPEPALHEFPLTGAIRLVTALDAWGGVPQPRLSAGRAFPVVQGHRSLNLISSGMPLWGYSDSMVYVRDAMLSFEAPVIEKLLGDAFDPHLTTVPLIAHQDERLFSIVGLLVDAIGQSDPASEPYGEGLICAAAAILFGRKDKRGNARPDLAPRLIASVLDLILAKLPESVSVTEMAQCVGLSPAHFSRAFRKATGKAPHQWQMHARIDRSFELLRKRSLGLEEVANQLGFTDASHFSRVFRSQVGMTPGQWRRQSLCSAVAVGTDSRTE